MSKEVVSIQQIAQSIYLIRGQRVMLSQDLAILYGVAVKVLNQAVKRNAVRFPADFVFQLKAEELANLKQVATSSWGGPRRARPYAFTVKVNIAIMRAFVKLRQSLETNREL